MNNVALVLYAAGMIEELKEKGYDVTDVLFRDYGFTIVYEGDNMEMTLIVNSKM